MLGFIQDPATGDVFTYISDGTLLRSTNAGASWSVLSSGGTAQSFQPRALGQIRR
jgi:hypothetical protein